VQLVTEGRQIVSGLRGRRRWISEARASVHSSKQCTHRIQSQSQARGSNGDYASSLQCPLFLALFNGHDLHRLFGSAESARSPKDNAYGDDDPILVPSHRQPSVWYQHEPGSKIDIDYDGLLWLLKPEETVEALLVSTSYSLHIRLGLL
jgi:hypothetical protein